MNKQLEVTAVEAKVATAVATQAVQEIALSKLAQARAGMVSLTKRYLDIDEIEKGYVLRCLYAGVEGRRILDKETGEDKTLFCAIFVTLEDGRKVTYESASKPLVGVLQDGELMGHIKPHQSWLEITFLGKKKNKTNAFSSAQWNVDVLELAQ